MKNFSVPQAVQKWTTWKLVLKPKAGDRGMSKLVNAWSKLARALTPGKHRIRIEVWAMLGSAAYATSKAPISAGEFVLTRKKGDRISLGMSMPKSAYRGSDRASIIGQIKVALVKSRLIRSKKEIIRVSVTRGWNHGTYTRTGQKYRTIHATVLWADKDGDKVCHYSGYLFISDRVGGRWQALRFRSHSSGRGASDCR